MNLIKLNVCENDVPFHKQNDMGLFSKLFGKKDEKKNDDLNEGLNKDQKPHEGEHHSKWHDKLQEWSNDNARDIEEDDADPLKSGL